jgi:hypothetical protein
MMKALFSDAANELVAVGVWSAFEGDDEVEIPAGDFALAGCYHLRVFLTLRNPNGPFMRMGGKEFHNSCGRAGVV